jgi:hypothetical protein
MEKDTKVLLNHALVATIIDLNQMSYGNNLRNKKGGSVTRNSYKAW